MSAPKVIKRQRHGIEVQQITVTLPGKDMSRLRKEAQREGITVSRHVVNLIARAWANDTDIAAQPETAVA